MASIPPPIRASLGLLASVVDAAQGLLDRAPELLERTPELPMEVVGNAMQASLRAQQRYAEFIARGDELLSHLRGAPDAPPAWATFDDDPAPDDPAADDADPADVAAGEESGTAEPVVDAGLRTPAHGDDLLSQILPSAPIADLTTEPAAPVATRRAASRKATAAKKVPPLETVGRTARKAGPAAAPTSPGTNPVPPRKRGRPRKAVPSVPVTPAPATEDAPAIKQAAVKAPAVKRVAPTEDALVAKTARAKKVAPAKRTPRSATTSAGTVPAAPAPTLDPGLTDTTGQARPRSPFDRAADPAGPDGS